MIQELENRNIFAQYVFTSWAVEAVFNLNLTSFRFNQNFLHNYEMKIIDGIHMQKKTESLNNLKEYFEKHPKILIYNMGKVGSSSIDTSLKKCNINCMHLHYLRNFDEDQMEAASLFLELKNKISKDGIKIISLVREPLSRDISAIMFGRNFQRCNVNVKSNSIQEMLIANSKQIYPYRYLFTRQGAARYPWFHDELECLTGINIYEYPFDKEKGYSIIKEGKIEILLLTMENLNNNKKNIMNFVGLHKFNLIKDNVGDNMIYKYAYKGIKNEMEMPNEVLDYYYNDNKAIEHFYNKQQIEKFRTKWKHST